MKLYSLVKLKEDYKEYKIGTRCIVIEIYDDKVVYLEILDDDGDTIDVVFDVPISIIEEV